MGLNRRSHSEQIREAERERVNSERRCEELAMELWGLEKRLMEPKQRLLSHTAGVLQLTHKGPRNGDGRPQMPGSPESMATYSNFRNSLEAVKINHDLFDDRHLYKEFDRLDGFGMDGSRGGGDPEADKRLAETQNKLDQLCHRLREVVIKTLPQREDAYNRPPHISSTEPAGQHLDEQLRYLDQNIDVIDSEQDAIMRKHDEADRAMEETIGDLNREVRSLLLPFDGSMPEPPDLTGRSLKQQLLYFQSTINTVESELRRAELTRSQAPSFGGDDSNIQASLERVWNSIQESEADERRRRHQRRQTMLDNGQEPDEDEISDLDAPAEPFSVLAFTAKVQDLYRSATRLKDQKDVLTRQIKQQRELNNKSDATRDREQAQLEAELKESRDAFNRLQDQSDQLQAELMDIMEKLDKLRAGSDLWKAEKEKLEEETKELRDVLLERNEEIEGLEEQLDELKLSKSAASAQQMERAEQKIEDLTRQLSSAESRIAELTQDLTEKGKSSQELALAEGRIKDLTSELASARETIAALQDKLDDTESSTRSDLARSSSRIQELEKTIADLQTNSTKSSGLQKALVEQEQAVSNLHDALDQKEQQLENATKALQTARKETEDATLELARLQTELTISRAELDGAYGTRAERAADIAANPLVQKEIDALLNSNMKLQEEVQGKEGRVEELKRELGGLVEEYEGLVREGVEWEGERRRLEAEIDKLREEREGLEEKLGEERVKWLGVGAGAASPLGSPRVSQGPGSVTGGREMTSTSVLKNEFKKMMRDTRAESARALRVRPHYLLLMISVLT